MPHDFEIADTITLDATPEEVWEAISTGPGVDSWFMGRTEIEPRAGGARRLDMSDVLGFVQESTITAWEPGARLAFREEAGPDGSFAAVEYLLEGRDGGATTLRYVHSGVLAGDDWEAQYDGMRAGDRMYLEQLAVHLKHFPGRRAVSSLFLFGPAVPDESRAWSAFAAALSLTGDITPGAPVRLAVPGLPAAEGVVEYVGRPHYLGVRTADALHLLVRGYQDVLVVDRHGFSADEDVHQIESAWRAWLTSTDS